MEAGEEAVLHGSGETGRQGGREAGRQAGRQAGREADEASVSTSAAVQPFNITTAAERLAKRRNFEVSLFISFCSIYSGTGLPQSLACLTQFVILDFAHIPLSFWAA